METNSASNSPGKESQVASPIRMNDGAANDVTEGCEGAEQPGQTEQTEQTGQTVSGKRKHVSDDPGDERSVRTKFSAPSEPEQPAITTAVPTAADGIANGVASDQIGNGASSSNANGSAAANGSKAESPSGEAVSVPESSEPVTGADPNVSDSTGAATAAAAVAAADVQGLQLDRESLVFAAECHMAVLQDDDGDTPLHLAVAQANKHLVHHLVYLISRSSRNVDIANALRQTPLHLAVITGQSDLIRILLANNAASNMPDRLGRTCLHLAAERNYLECCTALLEARDVDLEVRNFDGYTPVHTAVFHNSYGALQQLLDAGASVNPHDGKSGRTPLHHAAESGNTGMVQYLIRQSADIDATTYAGNTPLHSAAGRGHEHIVSLLVTAGADTRLQNTEGDNAADVARCRNAFRGAAVATPTTAAVIVATHQQNST